MTRHLTTAIAVLLVGATTTIGAVADDVKLAVPATPIEQCIRDNAAKVEAAVPDLIQSVDFLVSDVCAVSVAAEQTRQQQLANERRYSQWDKMCEAQKAARKNAKPDADSDKNMAAFCDNNNMFRVGFITEPASDDDSGTSYIGGAKPAAAVALAARLLLDLRLSHKNPEHKN